MVYDEGLAERIRERLGADPAVTEKKMFGGLAFLHEGNMAVGVVGDELIVRVGSDATATALARPDTRAFDLTGRPMRGWVVVGTSGIAEDAALDTWIEAGRTYAASLPPK
ncbi:TfoX/Sxy family protein [Streptomyces tritici]|uniref:TfoX/Sxy family protein n=1 Tax=Streptomyces tritici TaxID=2054410 RepID=UPI003AF118D6